MGLLLCLQLPTAMFGPMAFLAATLANVVWIGPTRARAGAPFGVVAAAAAAGVGVAATTTAAWLAVALAASAGARVTAAGLLLVPLEPLLLRE